MLILLSPAKTLDFETPFAEEATKPRFATEASRIARAASKLGPTKLSELMHISPALADLNRHLTIKLHEELRRSRPTR